jgi:type I restriction enzyme S subunit
LGALDDKIELNRRMNETLEALAQSLFKSWFVDATQSALPKGWREGSILEVAKLLSGGTPKTEREDYWNGNILWASAKDVSQCGQTFLVTTERTITKKGLEESATQLIPAFCTVVVARGATTGRMTMFGREIAMNQTCYALASTTGTPFALYCLFHHAIDALVQTAHGSVFDTITTSTFAASMVALPPQQVFDAFEKTVSPIFARILSNIKESRTLAALRDALLPKLLSGELRVPKASGK